MQVRTLGIALIFSFALAGCGGGAPGPGPSTAPPHGDMAKVVFSVVIPGAPGSSSARRPDYVSSNTQSLTVTVNSGTPQVFALTPATNPNCSASGGETTCSNLVAVAPPGTNDDFTFDMFASTNGTGTPLSIANDDNVEINKGVANQLGTLTLNPVLGSIAMSVSGSYAAGTSSSGNAIDITAKDPSGATIIAPGDYITSSGTANPIGLGLSGAGAANFTLSASSLAGPSNSATLAYNGNDGAVTVTASATGVTSQQQTITPTAQPITLTLASSASAADYLITNGPYELDFYASGITGTVTPVETGYSAPFTLQSTTCSSSEVSFSPSAGNSVSNGSAFTVSAVAAGSNASPAICTATFADTNGQTVSATFSVTTIGFTLDKTPRK